MKYFRLLVLFVAFLFSVSSTAQIKIDLKKKLNRETNQRANEKTDKAIDESFDQLEEGVGGIFKKKDKNKKTEKETAETSKIKEKANEESESLQTAKKSAMDVQWSKFDFVPGDNIIFEDSPSASERNGEFPSRWDLVKGQVEIMTVNGENVIALMDGNPMIVPYLKNADKDYLPDVFTVEFDIFRPASGNRFKVFFHDTKNQKNYYQDVLEINLNRADYKEITSEYNSGKDNEEGNWIHVSIAHTNGQLKVYLDENRLLNIPRMGENPTGISIQAYFAEHASGKTWYMKNFRLAEGGVPYYDRALQDGKIIVTGIKFDVAKASLKPESIGPINEILYVMQKDPGINFSVEGHTDSDGDENTNQKLSEDRAEIVMNKLIELGIAPARLKSKGFGESKPMADNATAEGKAQNRRVEFVKFDKSESSLYAESSEQTDNTTPEKAILINNKEIISGVLKSSDDALWYKVNLNRNQQLKLEITEGCGLIYIDMFDKSASTKLAQDTEMCNLQFTNSDGNDSFLLKVYLPPNRTNNPAFSFKLNIK